MQGRFGLAVILKGKILKFNNGLFFHEGWVPFRTGKNK